MKKNHLLTSESVSEGHPDKMADQISDAILDAYLSKDPDSKVACETMVTHRGVIVAGEIHSQTSFDDQELAAIIRNVIHDIGYDDFESGCKHNSFSMLNLLHQQSQEIRNGVDEGGAGDQGLMFGYACNETRVLMPLGIWLAHRIMERQAELRKSNTIPWLLPDAKSQVTVIYEYGKPIGIDTILVSTQHQSYNDSGSELENKVIEEAVIEEIIKPVIPDQFDKSKIKFLVNPSGRFTIGGAAADTGLTGRKIIVDTYGGSCPHGGGAFSGKDATKVDRSGAYMARYIAKSIVGSGIAKKCIVQLSYAIGKPKPVSFLLDFQATGKQPEWEVKQQYEQMLDLTPRGIINKLELKRPIYQKTAAYGHFGRELPEFTWELMPEVFDK